MTEGFPSIEETKEKRVFHLVGTWNYLLDSGLLDRDRFTLSMPLLDEVVEHYLDDLRIVRIRYNIPHHLQLHKVAGLTTSSILRYRPIIPLEDAYYEKPEIYANETFAIVHGLALCGEYSLEKCEAIAQEAWFDRWVNDFLHLLHRRNHTAESLAFIFQTLSTFIFPKNLDKLDFVPNVKIEKV